MQGTATTCALALGTLLHSTATLAKFPDYPITPTQRTTAQQVAQQGVPLSALSPNAPDSYTVRRGDTLWRISGLFLRQPWRWPELWGMNLQAIANPHLIYPGQVLYLVKSDGYARLTTSPHGATPTVKLSPQVRGASQTDMALPTLQMHIVEAFLAEPLVVDSDTVAQAPHILANSQERTLIAQGDRIYARGSATQTLQQGAEQPGDFRIFRDAIPLRDPITREILGYESQYIGQAKLVHGETLAGSPADYRPATLHVSKGKEEIRAGDRLLPEPPRQYLNFVPHAPAEDITAHVVSIYGGTSVRYGTQYQVVAINKGRLDHAQPGMVLALMSKGNTVVDKTDPQRPTIQLPDEENGLAMVFRSFDRVSYALIMDVQRGVQVGDQLTVPR